EPDLDELGLLEPGRAFDVAHQRRDARVRLREADDLHLPVRLLDRLQIDAFRQLANELIEQVHRLVAIRLQRLDDLLARQHLLDLVAELVDLLDLRVELGDLRLEELVARVLVLDARGQHDVHEADDRHTEDRERDRERDELALARLPLLLAMGQQVDAHECPLIRSCAWRGPSRSSASAPPARAGAAARARTSASSRTGWRRSWPRPRASRSARRGPAEAHSRRRSRSGRPGCTTS